MKNINALFLKITISCLLVGIISSTFADGCALKNGPSPDITAYIIRLNSDLSRLKSEAQKK